MPGTHGEQTEFTWGVRGGLLALSPGISGLTLTASPAAVAASAAQVGLALVAGAGLALAGALLHRFRHAAFALGLGAFAIVATSTLDTLTSSPLLGFYVAAVAMSSIGSMWLAPFSGASREVQARAGSVVAIRTSAYVALLVAVVVFTTEQATERWALWSSGISLAVPVAWAGGWAVTVRRQHPVRAVMVAAAVLSSLAGGTLLLLAPASHHLSALMAAALLLLLATPGSGLWSRIVEHPARLLVVTFALMSAVGTVLLAMPAAATDAAIDITDAAFTAVSAVCVTGLIVLDTPTDFSSFGQGCILFMIQAGGLGIMTFYTAALAAVGQRLSLRHERAIAGALNVQDRATLTRALGRVLALTLSAELVGAAVLCACFLTAGDPLGYAAWRGLFTAVSAFCNAGFALQSASLIPYQSEPLVLHTVALLIVLGGLSPAAVLGVPAFVRRQRASLEVRLILTTSAILLALAFVVFAAFDWTYSLAGLSWSDRLHNAWFQSVTLRTAGFNSVELTQTSPATQTFMIAMMFIGGSPGGTAGGIKTTTLAVLVLAVLAALKRHSEMTTFGRRLAHRSVYKATAIITLGILSTVFALIAIQLTQRLPLETAVFEVVSALGTVGLSLGGTAQLDGVGKVIVIMCMFAGRLGPLTLFLFLSEQRSPPTWIHPEQEVDVG